MVSIGRKATLAIIAAVIVVTMGIVLASVEAPSDAQAIYVVPGAYRITSDLDPATSYLRVFGIDVVGVGPLTGDSAVSDWSIEAADSDRFRLRVDDKYLTRRGDPDGSGGLIAGRFVDLLDSRPQSLSQLWTFAPAEGGTYRITSAWWPADGALTRDTIATGSGATEPADSISLYTVQDWSSQRWSLEPIDLPTSASVTARWSCLGPDGRVDVEIQNRGDAPATYQVQIGDLTVRSVTVDTGATNQTTATGRADGQLSIVVKLDGSVNYSETVVIDCDPDDTEVAIVVSCLGGNGRIDTYLTNIAEGAEEYSVAVGDLVPRRRVVATGETVRVSVTGRSDGPLPITVDRSATPIFADTAHVACDGEEPDPAPTVPDPAPPPEPEIVPVWDNVIQPPALDNPLVIDSIEGIEAYRAEWPAYDIFCSGELYEVDLRSADRDVLIDLTGNDTPLEIPLIVYATRHVVVVGAEFDLAVQPGCEAGQLPTQPVEGGPLVPGLSIHPRVPSGAALRIANPLAAWVEGAYIKMNGIEADCMVANNGATQSQADALLERDWYVINSRCDGQEGASPGDLGGDGVHGDFLHFQGDGMFRDLVFENVVHLSGQNGVTANQRTPDGAGSGEVFVRNYYFDYDPDWQTHGPNSPSGGVGFSVLVGDASRITVENYHYRNVHDSCAGMVITFDDAPLRIGDPDTNCEPHDGFHKIPGNPQDPAGQPSPIVGLLFAEIADLGRHYESPFNHTN